MQNPVMISVGEWLVPFRGIVRAVKYDKTKTKGRFFKKTENHAYYIEVLYDYGRLEKIIYDDPDDRDKDFLELRELLIQSGLVFMGDVEKVEPDSSSSEEEKTETQK